MLHKLAIKLKELFGNLSKMVSLSASSYLNEVSRFSSMVALIRGGDFLLCMIAEPGTVYSPAKRENRTLHYYFPLHECSRLNNYYFFYKLFPPQINHALSLHDK